MNEFEDIEQLLKPQCEFKASDTLKQEVMRKARQEVSPRRIVRMWPWLAAACVVGFVVMFLMPPKPATETHKIAQAIDSVEVKQPVVTPSVPHEETLAQTPPPKQSHRRKKSSEVKPQEKDVRYMTDEMVDQLLARNQQARAQQPSADYQEIGNEIKRRGEQLTNDLLAFAGQTINDK